MSAPYYLPPQIARLLTPERLRQSKNLGLLLDKYPPQSAVENNEGKNQWLQSLTLYTHLDTRLAEHAYKRWQNTIAAMQGLSFTATTQWRMVVGLGGKTVLETDLALHHLYGIPFIPGSALKGLTRAYVTGEIEEHKSEQRETDDVTIQRIFGTQKTAGSVLFFDAMPVHGKATFDLDIMNAHYPRYYGENQLPTSSQDPKPVTFLTIANTAFLFAVAPRCMQDTKDASATLQWLQTALQKYGVGGKTNAGYGYFADFQQYEAATNASELSSMDMEMVSARETQSRLEKLKESEVANQINAYYQQWQKLTSQQARTLLAQAILAKVQKAGREKVSAEKGWYKDLMNFLQQKD